MNRIELYRELWRHLNLSESRNPLITENKVAKYFYYISAVVMIGYFIMLGVLFGWGSNNIDEYYSTEFFMLIMPYVLVVDFFFRFINQQTPAQMVKPYMLLPIKRNRCIEVFLLRTVLTWGNTYWLFMIVPYAFIAVLFTEGFGTFCGFLAGCIMLILINSQWYLLVRTLLHRTVLWWILPITVYALLFAPPFIDAIPPSMNMVCNLLADFGLSMSRMDVLPWLGMIALLTLLLYINRSLQFVMVYNEISGKEEIKDVKTREISFLTNFGQIGQYIQLELLMMMRCKNVRKSVIFATIFVMIFAVLLAFTDMYDGPFMSQFFMVYCLVCYGAMILVKIMCYEGNFIDLLMVRREHVLSLLHAKYYVYSAMVIIPFLCLIPITVVGKCSFLMLASLTIFTIGIQNALFIALAPINRTTMPLNTKLVGRGGMENNYLQIVIEMLSFILPIILVRLFALFFNETIACIIIMLLGIMGIATHHVWLRYIYNRFLRVKYRNLEGFHASR